MKTAITTIKQRCLHFSIDRRFVNVMIFATTLALTLAYFVGHAEKQPAAPGSLSGTAALQSLKENGQYDSLAAALSAARYQINAAPPSRSVPFYANNPGQQLRAEFSSSEVRVTTTVQAKVSDAELRLRLAGCGYGEQVEPVMAGELTVSGNRIAIRHSAIEEWYVNKPEGLEQGFTLSAPPAHGKQAEGLRVQLVVGNGWRAIVHGKAQGALFERQADRLTFGYDHLLAYDAQGRALPARLAFDKDTLTLLVNDEQAVYPLTIDPILTQQQKLTAPDAAMDDQFGFAVALSGSTAVIGAPSDDLAGTDQGSAYVFVRSGTSWSQQARLNSVDGAANDQFGYSVALGDDSVVVGAPGDDIGANSTQGSAYVFVRNGTSWSQQQKLIANDGAVNDQFGVSVALNGETVVVGAYFDSVGANRVQGSAYVFARSGAVWIQQQKLTANDGADSDQFGVSVALSGDTVVVGAGNDDSGANTDQGSAYVFVRSGTSWMQQQKLIAGDGAASDLFGRSVALSGDTVVVGAPGDDGANTDQGSAYVFIRSGTSWTQQQKLAAADGAFGDFFGTSVALSGDTLIVGAATDDVGANGNQGSAYVFARSGTSWTQQRKLFAADGKAAARFGNSVALSGDAVLVGANGDNGTFTTQGAAYVFVIRNNTFLQQQTLSASDGAANDFFGVSVALSGDTLVIGAVGEDSGANTDQGSAYVFVRTGNSWAQQQKLSAGDAAANDQFGKSVALSGDTMVLGAPGDNSSQGAAYVFTRSGTIWAQQQKLTANDVAAEDNFGFSVALSGDSVVVGAPGDDSGANLSQGSAYVFVHSGTNWTQQQKLTASDGADADQFGFSVALFGNTVVVGALYVNIGGNKDDGAAYVFTRSGTIWTQQQKLTASDRAANDLFGASVALSGDTLVVGAPQDEIGANLTQGSAYVFTRFGTIWAQQQKLTANDGAAGDFFGISVALSGDTLVVGAYFDDMSVNTNLGSAYVFTRSGTVWTQQQKLLPNQGDGSAGDLFGHSIALSGDMVVVGASGVDVGTNPDQGRSYVFVCSTCATIALNPVSLPDAAIGTSYNQTVTASGGNGPYQFSLSGGGLPPGLSLAQNGLLSGTPTTAGTYDFTITATILSSLCPGSRSYTLIVQPICSPITVNPANPTLPPSTTGQMYGRTFTATGGTTGYSFTISAGALPNGVTLSSGGALSGVPSVAGNFNFTVTATDIKACTGARVYSLTINAASTPTPTPTPTPLVTNVQFSTTSYNAAESAGFATITVTRTGELSGTVTVDYATSDVAAQQRTDYTIGAGTLTFAPGEAFKTFPVLIIDDMYIESNETLNLILSNPTGGAQLNSPSVATLTIADNDSGSPTTNPNDQARFFVQQHFYDFLSRVPDQGGLDFWIGQITQCGSDFICTRNKRIDVSNAFFYELEYQQTGAYVFRLYRAAFGNTQPFPNQDISNQTESKKLPGYAVFAPDRARVVGGASLAVGQQDIANAFVQRAEFLARYPASQDGTMFVEALLGAIKNDTGVDLTSQRAALINLFSSGGRGAVLYRLADDNINSNPINNRAFIDEEYNRAFVFTQYAGYLSRDSDIGGFLFWLGQVNSAPLRDTSKQHAMVCAFITATEYQQRFSSVVTHTNAECGP